MNVSLTGDITAHVREVFTGQSAAQRRLSLTIEGTAYYSRRITDAASLLVSAPQMTSMRIDGLAEISRPLIIEYTLSGTQFGTRSGNLFLLRPLALFNREVPIFSRTDRLNPVILRLSSVREDRISLNLPPGFVVDEIPRDIDLRLAFGEFRLYYSKHSNRVLMHRKLVVSNPDIPASEYARVKVMFDAVSTSSQIPLILERQ
jgi:hypothetical protein